MNIFHNLHTDKDNKINLITKLRSLTKYNFHFNYNTVARAEISKQTVVTTLIYGVYGF